MQPVASRDPEGLNPNNYTTVNKIIIAILIRFMK